MELSAAGLARSIAAGEVSAGEVLEAVIARIDDVDARTRAVAQRRFEAARNEAAEADQAIARGDDIGPLHGVPVTVKECLEVSGLPATFGIAARSGTVAAIDDPHVARLRAAGAIVVATTNVAQLLAFAETDNPVYGRTNNPWDPDRSCGGSSGGEGALVGAGASPLGFGTDIGGSVRIPAAWCGAVGFKPSPGRCPDVGRYSFDLDSPIASQVGVLGPAVADVALGFGVISGGSQSTARRAERLTVGVALDDGVFAASPAVRRGCWTHSVSTRSRAAHVCSTRRTTPLDSRRSAPRSTNSARTLRLRCNSATSMSC